MVSVAFRTAFFGRLNTNFDIQLVHSPTTISRDERTSKPHYSDIEQGTESTPCLASIGCLESEKPLVLSSRLCQQAALFAVWRVWKRLGAGSVFDAK